MTGEERHITTLVPQTIMDLFQMGTGVQRTMHILIVQQKQNHDKILPVLSVQWSGLLGPKVRLTPVLPNGEG